MKNFTPLSIIVKFFLFFSFLFLTLSAKIVNDFYSVETWYFFEPGEEYDVVGSYFYVTNDREQAYFSNVSDLISTKRAKAKTTAKEDSKEQRKVILTWSDVSQNADSLSKNSLGLQLNWDRLGSHFVDIIPSSELGNIKEVPAKSIEEISLWVWSGNYEHEIAAVFTRNNGYQYVVPMAKLNFLGWKKLVAKIPEIIKTDSKDAYYSDEDFYFDRLRIYTDPNEKVSGIYVFLDNLEVLRKLNYKSYDGEDLIPVIRKKLDIGNKNIKNESERKNSADDNKDQPNKDDN